MCPIPPTRRRVAAFIPAARLLRIVVEQKNRCLKLSKAVIGLPVIASMKPQNWWPKDSIKGGSAPYPPDY
jgi:hypothetical protein